jgi:hypothetical protein
MAFDIAGLRALGGFDRDTGVGTLAPGEDDLPACCSAVSAGHRLVSNKPAFVRHPHRADFAAPSDRYGYGVGATAHLAKTVMDRPIRLVELDQLGRHGVTRVLDPRGAKRRANASLDQRGWPAGLARAERWGMLCGPAAYFRSRALLVSVDARR